MEVVPFKKRTYSWRYDGYEGISHVTFELFEEGNQARVVLTRTGLYTFPATEAAFAQNNFIMGWTDIIDSSLKNYLE